MRNDAVIKTRSLDRDLAEVSIAVTGRRRIPGTRAFVGSVDASHRR